MTVFSFVFVVGDESPLGASGELRIQEWSYRGSNETMILRYEGLARSHEYETRPVERMIPVRRGLELALRPRQRLAGRPLPFDHFLVEGRHEGRGCFIGYAPKTHHDVPRTGIEKCPREAQHTLASNHLPLPCLAGGKNDQIGLDRQLV